MASLDRVAVIRLSALGDVALASAVVEALNGRGEVLFVTRERFAGLYEDDPRLAGRVVVRPRELEAAHHAIRDFEPTAVIDLQGTLRSARLIRGLGSARVSRVQKDSMRRRLAVVGWRGWEPRSVHRRFLEALEAVSGRAEVARPTLHLTPEATKMAARTLEAERSWVGMSPGSVWRNKRWPLDRYLETARQLLERPEVSVAVFAGPDDAPIVDAFGQAFPDGARVRSVQVPLAELPAHLAGLDVLITGDSGPLHVAEAVDTPVVSLFGPTTRHFGFFPLGRRSRVIELDRWCRPCHVHGGDRCPLGHHRCMLDISVLHVVAETGSVLDVTASTSGSGTPEGGR